MAALASPTGPNRSSILNNTSFRGIFRAPQEISSTMIFQTFLQSKQWQHKDPGVRLEAIAELQHSFDPNDEGADEAGSILADLATRDPDNAVRLAAIAHVRDVTTLNTLREESDADIANAALMQYCRVVSG